MNRAAEADALLAVLGALPCLCLDCGTVTFRVYVKGGRNRARIFHVRTCPVRRSK